MHSTPVRGLPARLAALAAALVTTLVSPSAAAQGTAASAPPVPTPVAATQTPAQTLGFGSVAQALGALQARDGAGTVVTHSDGWTIVNEPLASAQWSFTPAGHEAHPSVVRRVIRREPGGVVQVDNVQLCEAPAAACSRLQAEFESMNERIRQAVRARGRQGSTPPSPPQ